MDAKACGNDTSNEANVTTYTYRLKNQKKVLVSTELGITYEVEKKDGLFTCPQCNESTDNPRYVKRKHESCIQSIDENSKAYYDFTQYLAYIIFTCCGQPHRTTEILLTTHNTSVMRTVFWSKGTILILFPYSKTSEMKGNDSYIPMHLPKEFASIILVMHVYVRPWVIWAKNNLKMHASALPHVSVGNLLSYENENSMPNYYELVPFMNSKTFLHSAPLGIRDQRQCLTAFMKAKVKHPEKMRIFMKMYDEAGGHTTGTSMEEYAQDNHDHRNVRSEVEWNYRLMTSLIQQEIFGFEGQDVGENTVQEEDAQPPPKRLVSEKPEIVSLFNAAVKSKSHLEPMFPTASHQKEALQLLRKWLKDVTADFKSDAQREMVSMALYTRNDFLSVLPMNSGKSFAYELFSFQFPNKILIVFVPCVSIAMEKIKVLKQKGIKCGLWYGSPVSVQDCHIVFVKPEDFNNQAFIHYVMTNNLKIGRIYIDEAHCLEVWSFRVGMENVYNSQVFGIPITLMTGTCSNDFEKLWLHKFKNLHVIRGGCFPSNISLSVNMHGGEEESLTLMTQTVIKESNTLKSNEVIIVFVYSLKKAEMVRDSLSSIPLVMYNSHLSSEEKEGALEIISASNNHKVIVSTPGLGMGVNLGGRCVVKIHQYGVAHCIEDWVQQIARGGRTGKPCTAVTWCVKHHLTKQETDNVNVTALQNIAREELKKVLLDTNQCRVQMVNRIFYKSSAVCSTESECDVCKGSNLSTPNAHKSPELNPMRSSSLINSEMHSFSNQCVQFLHVMNQYSNICFKCYLLNNEFVSPHSNNNGRVCDSKVCFQCLQSGHQKQHCPLGSTSLPSNLNICYKCWLPGESLTTAFHDGKACKFPSIIKDICQLVCLPGFELYLENVFSHFNLNFGTISAERRINYLKWLRKPRKGSRFINGCQTTLYILKTQGTELIAKGKYLPKTLGKRLRESNMDDELLEGMNLSDFIYDNTPSVSTSFDSGASLTPTNLSLSSDSSFGKALRTSPFTAKASPIVYVSNKCAKPEFNAYSEKRVQNIVEGYPLVCGVCAALGVKECDSNGQRLHRHECFKCLLRGRHQNGNRCNSIRPDLGFNVCYRCWFPDGNPEHNFKNCKRNWLDFIRGVLFTIADTLPGRLPRDRHPLHNDFEMKFGCTVTSEEDRLNFLMWMVKLNASNKRLNCVDALIWWDEQSS